METKKEKKKRGIRGGEGEGKQDWGEGHIIGKRRETQKEKQKYKT